MKGIGLLGEQYAADLLTLRGYRVVTRNYRAACGEIDLIAEQADIVAFVEVKTRGPRPLGRPAEAVTISKQRRIIQTAMHYLMEYPTDRQPRFDVIEIMTQQGCVTAYRHWKGAFELDQTNRPD